MARRRRGGFGGILALLVGAWAIGLFVGKSDRPARVETPSQTTFAQPQSTAAETALASREEQPAGVSTTPEPALEKVAELRWIRGRKVAFRAGPGATFAVLDRFGPGRKVSLVSAEGAWSKVRDELTRREGWVASRLLSDQEPAKRKPKAASSEPEQKPAIVPRPQVSDAEIAERIIAESIANYSGNCPCPFNRDRAGRRCGKRSAYSRPGGESPICFAGDVTREMISAFRRRL